ncbi:MAG: ABC transporter substrate-binding protein [Deltaproteobacteria bacterium]|nr:ABC transporter substrate-binding protein [Deltaproteobacteria bacterium]
MSNKSSALSAISLFVLIFRLLPSLSEAAESRPVVSLSSPGAGSAYAMVFRIAEHQGYYLDEGLDVRILSGVKTATSVQMLVGGTVDATQTVGPTTLAAMLQGAALKIVMVFNSLTTNPPTRSMRKKISALFRISKEPRSPAARRAAPTTGF